MRNRLNFVLGLIASLWLFVSPNAHATYAFVGSASNSANGATITYSPTAGNYVVVGSMTSAGGGSPTATIADNGSGSSWTTRVTTTNVSSNYITFFSGIVGTGVTTITITYNGGKPGSVFLGIVEYSGLSSSGWQGITTGNLQTASCNGTNAVTSSALTVSTQPAALIGWMWELGGNGGGTAGASPITFTRRINVGGIMTEDARVTSTGTPVANATNSNCGTDDLLSYAIAISEPGGGSCTHDFWSSSGSYAVPNGSSGSYWSVAGAFATPNCSSGTYWQQTGATGST